MTVLPTSLSKEKDIAVSISESIVALLLPNVTIEIDSLVLLIKIVLTTQIQIKRRGRIEETLVSEHLCMGKAAHRCP